MYDTFQIPSPDQIDDPQAGRRQCHQRDLTGSRRYSILRRVSRVVVEKSKKICVRIFEIEKSVEWIDVCCVNVGGNVLGRLSHDVSCGRWVSSTLLLPVNVLFGSLHIIFVVKTTSQNRQLRDHLEIVKVHRRQLGSIKVCSMVKVSNLLGWKIWKIHASHCPTRFSRDRIYKLRPRDIRYQCGILSASKGAGIVIRV